MSLHRGIGEDLLQSTRTRGVIHDSTPHADFQLPVRVPPTEGHDTASNLQCMCMLRQLRSHIHRLS